MFCRDVNLEMREQIRTVGPNAGFLHRLLDADCAAIQAAAVDIVGQRGDVSADGGSSHGHIPAPFSTWSRLLGQRHLPLPARCGSLRPLHRRNPNDRYCGLQRFNAVDILARSIQQ